MTQDIADAGEQTCREAQQAQVAQLNQAAQALAQEVASRHAKGRPVLRDKDAVPFLVQSGLKRNQARQLIEEREGVAWQLRQLTGQRGNPIALLPIPSQSGESREVTAEIPSSETPLQSMGSEHPISADRMDTGRRKSDIPNHAPDAAFIDQALFPPPGFVQPVAAKEQEVIPLDD